MELVQRSPAAMARVRSLFAGYLKGSIPLAPGFSLYGLGGVANVDLRRDFGLVYANETGLSYGLGMEFDLATNGRLSLEWTHLATGDNLGYPYDVNQASIAMAWRCGAVPASASGDHSRTRRVSSPIAAPTTTPKASA